MDCSATHKLGEYSSSHCINASAQEPWIFYSAGNLMIISAYTSCVLSLLTRTSSPHLHRASYAPVPLHPLANCSQPRFPTAPTAIASGRKWRRACRGGRRASASTPTSPHIAPPSPASPCKTHARQGPDRWPADSQLQAPADSMGGWESRWRCHESVG